jgi:sulfur transfer complex TusBCD TusB component (DsrH family)
MENLRKYVIYHFIESLSLKEHLSIVENLFQKGGIDVFGKDKYTVLEYYNNYKLRNKMNESAIVLNSNEETDNPKIPNKLQIYSIEPETFLQQLENNDKDMFLLKMPRKVKNRIILLKNGEFIMKKIEECYESVSFIMNSVFKKKDLFNPRARNSTGAIVNDIKNIELQKMIETLILLKNNKWKPNKQFTEFSRISLCGILEIIMRFYNDILLNDKIYFLNPVENIVTLTENVFDNNSK